MADKTPEEIKAETDSAKVKADAAEAARVEKARLAEEKKMLIKMAKPGEEPLFVHPTTVADHVLKGWKPAKE